MLMIVTGSDLAGGGPGAQLIWGLINRRLYKHKVTHTHITITNENIYEGFDGRPLLVGGWARAPWSFPYKSGPDYIGVSGTNPNPIFTQ